ncbi:unnamed protein product [Callosobruchus maculatus]|uniref:Uncharacterized protein n=1 Tax=Callosobruchus maculatus TaxID=64391 RepID=A0A653D0J3_CALMS|nr:unnamed protein product [Callosobruchus maculatus]
MEQENIDISAASSDTVNVKRKNDHSENVILQKFTTTFEHDIIKDVIKTQCTNQKNKITDDAVELVSEIAKTLVLEASLRAAKVASNEKRVLILDFP